MPYLTVLGYLLKLLQIVDVFKVESQPATYIANVVFSGQFASTVISFNKGASWQPLKPPNNARSNFPNVKCCPRYNMRCTDVIPQTTT